MQDTISELVKEEVGVAVGLTGAPLAGPAALPPLLVSTPPTTNRGCFGPPGGNSELETAIEQPLAFGVDYLRITVFGSFDEVAELVDRELVEPGELSHVRWSSVGPVDRWERLELLGHDLIQLKSPKSAIEPYVVVELKGEGCSACQDHLHRFMVAIDERWRWNGKRVDTRWDHHWLSPRLVRPSCEGGQFVSRSLCAGDWDWRENMQGETCYLGSRRKPRHVRWYDKRGFNRMELELHDQWAADLLHKFIKHGAEGFGQHAVGYLLSTVDFREVGSVTRLKRSPRPEWWELFIGAAEKVKTLTKICEDTVSPATPIGLADDWAKRNRRMLLRAEFALGVEWIRKRARYWSRQRGELEYGSDKLLEADDQAAVDALRLYAESGLCGTSNSLPF
jgi:hypothetical protein